MTIKIINKSQHPLPNYETIASAGMDLRADLDTPITLAPLGRIIVKTGLFIELPMGYEAQVRPRSGLAIKRLEHAEQWLVRRHAPAHATVGLEIGLGAQQTQKLAIKRDRFAHVVGAHTGVSDHAHLLVELGRTVHRALLKRMARCLSKLQPKTG